MKRLLIFAILACFIGCDREIPNPVTNPTIPDIPLTPTSLTVTVGDRMLHLSWRMADSSSIAGYKIYRAEFQADTLTEVYALIDSSTVTEFADSSLQNGQLYYYKVSAYNQNGVEGYQSNSTSGIPNLYSLIINEGNSTTNSRSVTLTLVAPTTTTLMQISNTPDFNGSPWEPFVNMKQWVLSEGVGLKTVYVMFRDGQGNTTNSYASDDVTYEILSYQYSIDVNAGALYAYSRDVELTINAPSGSTSMMISNLADYSGAVWERFVPAKSWFIPSETAANREMVTFYALFCDESGDSVAVEATDSITLAVSDAVDLLPVYQEPDNYQSVSLEWTRSLSEDFYSYRLFRSRDTNTVDTIVATVIDFAAVSHIDNLNLTDLPDDSPDSIYYMVRFYSIYDDSSDSDTILVMLKNNQPPAVTCFAGEVSYDTNDIGGFEIQAVLGWSSSNIPDFSHYVVYENDTFDSTTANPVSYEYDIGNLSYTIIKNIPDDTTFSYHWYYWLRIFDLGGRNSDFSSPDSISNY